MSATATVKGGIFESAGLTSLTQIQGTGPARRRISQLLSGKGMRTSRAIMKALDGVAAGGTATATVGRVEANTELGGKRTIESQSLVNRATVAGDVTENDTDFFNSLTGRTTLGASTVANKDGNPLGTR